MAAAEAISARLPLPRRGGITCPCSGLGCSRDDAGAAGQPAPPYVLGIDEISLLADYCADGVSSGALEAQTIPPTREEAERLRRFMDEPAAPSSKVRRVASDETWPYIETTTTQCLNCTNRESHFHGHECHHVTCTLCKIAYGYKCRSSGPTNLTARGKEERCECGYWPNVCERLELDHTSRLQTIPYPPRRSMRLPDLPGLPPK